VLCHNIYVNDVKKKATVVSLQMRRKLMELNAKGYSSALIHLPVPTG